MPGEQDSKRNIRGRHVHDAMRRKTRLGERLLLSRERCTSAAVYTLLLSSVGRSRADKLLLGLRELSEAREWSNMAGETREGWQGTGRDGVVCKSGFRRS